MKNSLFIFSLLISFTSNKLFADYKQELESNNSESQHEMTLEEILAEMPSLSQKARKQRPAVTPAGALYIDVYQESPVLIDYKGNGNETVNMSFEVVTKYLRSGQKVVPHFVRAHLVSTGASGHRTSIGEFNIDRRHRYYVSQTYGSRMDYAQFFIGGIALHQTDEDNYAKLGGPASHGCVRHHEKDADAMWELNGEAIENNNLINIKVYPFGEEVVLADGSGGTELSGFGAQLNDWLNNSIACTRRGENTCTTSWQEW